MGWLQRGRGCGRRHRWLRSTLLAAACSASSLCSRRGYRPASGVSHRPDVRTDSIPAVVRSTGNLATWQMQTQMGDRASQSSSALAVVASDGASRGASRRRCRPAPHSLVSHSLSDGSLVHWCDVDAPSSRFRRFTHRSAALRARYAIACLCTPRRYCPLIVFDHA